MDIFTQINKSARSFLTRNDAADMQRILQSSHEDLMQKIRMSGTDIEANSRDPFGDGDQTNLFGSKAQVLREVWSAGGDFFNVAARNGLSRLSAACFCGSLEIVRSLLSEQNNVAKHQMLERRECILRLTPLIICVIGVKCIDRSSVGTVGGQWNQVVQLLLREGAAVNARDIAGHTACFHASGSSSNAETLEILKILVAAKGDVNLPNRFGSISLHEAVLGDNLPALQTLLECGANLSLSDHDGLTSFELAKTYPAAVNIISAHSKSSNARTAWRATHRTCSQCALTKDSGMLLCSRCKSAFYCSKACQSAHWPTHKVRCSESDEDAVAIIPDPTCAAWCAADGRRVHEAGPVAAPQGAGKTFVVKVQAPIIGGNFLIYDESRAVHVITAPDHPRAADMARAVAAAGAGIPKAFFRARVVDGILYVLLGRPVSLRQW